MKFTVDLLAPFLGYLDLGMFHEANDELESLPNGFKTRSEVLSARLELLMAMERWEDGALLALSLSKLWPDHHEWYIRTAFCLHELKRTDVARGILLAGPKTLTANADFHYNMACYEAQLGNLEKAKEYLAKSFKMEKGFEADARIDPDLKPIWDSLDE